MHNSKYNCLQLTITAWLHPAKDHATRESKYLNNLIEPRQQHEDDFAYIIRIEKLYNINVWVYTPRCEAKVELFKPVDGFDKDRKDFRMLVWEKAGVEHCALIKNIANLIVERPNKSQHKFYYCDRCTYWFNSQIKYDKQESSHNCKPEIVCPKKKQITFINEHKRQNIKNITTADIECCLIDVTTNNSNYVIAEHIPISVGYIQRNEKMVFNKEDKLNHEANNTCHICGKNMY